MPLTMSFMAKQEGRFFHGYYDHYCFLPLYVFCRNQLLVSYLRPSKIDGAKHAWAILALLVKRLRQAWPQVKIILRADSGFCRWRILSWCERNNVGYIVGIAKNKRLNAITAQRQREARDCYAELGAKVRWFTDLHYAAGSWNRARRVIAKIEHTAKGSNPRYVVTNLKGDGQALYDKLYCARGEMENRIKEQPAGSVRRPHQLPPLVAQPVPLVVIVTGLHAVGGDPASGLEGHGAGQRLCRHPAPEVTQDRRGDLAQYPADPLPAIQVPVRTSDCFSMLQPGSHQN